ncbi:MAG: hypothetical protein JNG88_15435 [Phycisphaerales bacterium]|nr:hypothetical protein [Phycisphaerales bacterium]
MLRTRTSLSVAAIIAAAFFGQTALAQYDLSWHTIDCGGATFSTGGTFSLGGTIGQHDAGGPMTGGTFSLTGGFWPGAVSTPGMPGDLNCDGLVNNFDINAFVIALSDPALYQEMFPGCDRMNADINGDGLVNNFDIDPFVALLAG